MNCPYCGKQMEPGILNSRTPIHWAEDASGLPFPTKKGDVPLGPAFGLLRPKAYLCRDCGKVIVDC